MAINIDGDGLIALGGTASTQGRLRLAEDTDNGTNFIELTAPASVASDRVITFPDETTTVVGTDATQTLTNKTLGSGLVMGASTITSGTSQASTSGTSIDFTGIPAYVKRITVMFRGVSINTTSSLLIQLGTSGGVQNTGYVSSSTAFSGAAGSTGSSTAGLIVFSNDAAFINSGIITITNITSNVWVNSGAGKVSTGVSWTCGGDKDLAATLNQVRITTVSGTATFDAGTINILFE